MNFFNGVIVGLGNPEEKYAKTRHNFGFLVVQSILEKINLSFLEERNYYRAWQWNLNNNTSWMVCKTKTYMNQSGLCIRELRDRYGFESSCFLVLHDELDLAFGKLRFKFDGGSAGHRGVESIIRELGNSFFRLRLGIGRPHDKKRDIRDYVLSFFTDEEFKCLPEILDVCVKGLTLFCVHGLEKAMNFVHSFSLRKGEGESV